MRSTSGRGEPGEPRECGLRESPRLSNEVDLLDSCYHDHIGGKIVLPTKFILHNKYVLTTRTNYYILMRDISAHTTGCVLQEGEKETEGIAPEEGDAYEARCLGSRVSWAWANGPYPKKVTLYPRSEPQFQD